MSIEKSFWENAYGSASAEGREWFAKLYAEALERRYKPLSNTVAHSTRRESFPSLFAQDKAYERQQTLNRALEANGVVVLDAEHLLSFTSTGIVSIGPLGAHMSAMFVELFNSVESTDADRAA